MGKKGIDVKIIMIGFCIFYYDVRCAYFVVVFFFVVFGRFFILKRGFNNNKFI